MRFGLTGDLTGTDKGVIDGLVERVFGEGGGTMGQKVWGYKGSNGKWTRDLIDGLVIGDGANIGAIDACKTGVYTAHGGAVLYDGLPIVVYARAGRSDVWLTRTHDYEIRTILSYDDVVQTGSKVICSLRHWGETHDLLESFNVEGHVWFKREGAWVLLRPANMYEESVHIPMDGKPSCHPNPRPSPRLTADGAFDHPWTLAEKLFAQDVRIRSLCAEIMGPERSDPPRPGNLSTLEILRRAWVRDEYGVRSWALETAQMVQADGTHRP